jgi:Tol biopolymer transport system component
VFADTPDNTFLALSPDGSQLALVATEPAGATRVWVRPLSALNATPVAGTEGAASVFWSPDGRSLGFFADHKLKRVDLLGNALMTVCDVPQAEGMTGTWGSDGRILFAPVTGTTIFSVSPAGGTPSAAIVLEEAKEGVVQWPWFLSDGRRFVYVVRPPDRSRRTLMLEEPGGTPRPILTVDSNVEWVDPDYFVYARKDGALVAQRFNLSREQIVGEPVSIAASVSYGLGPGRAMFAVSRNGTVAYQPEQTSQMMWTDRMGTAIEPVGPAGSYTGLRLSPDGGRLLFGRMQAGTGTADLFVSDLRRRVEDRLTSHPGNEVGGVWLKGGRAVAFAADRGGPPHLFEKDLATGIEDELLPAGKRQLPTDVSPDGTTLVFVERTGRANGRLWTMALSSRARSALIGPSFDESDAHFSPDGRFIAYTSDQSGSGRYDLYIAPFPRGPEVRVSTAEGGRAPRWARDGRELFRQLSLLGPASRHGAGAYAPVIGPWQRQDAVHDRTDDVVRLRCLAGRETVHRHHSAARSARRRGPALRLGPPTVTRGA